MRGLFFQTALAVSIIAVATGTRALACSGADLVQKQKAYGDAVKTAFARDPGGDAARRAKLEAVIARYADLKNSTNGQLHHRHVVQGERRAADDLQVGGGSWHAAIDSRSAERIGLIG
jgi:hypothetical protein